MTITLFVGDNDEQLAITAQKKDPTAWLIDHNNYENFLLINPVKDITVYTSYSDLPSITPTRAVFFEILKKVDNIFYCPPVKWSDHSDNFSWNGNKSITEYFLCLTALIKNNVNELQLTYCQDFNYLALAELRKTEKRQIWVAGCSIAHGVGVEASQKFGTVISNKLNLPVSHLTKGGSSIEWAKDQILRSDIRKNDIVIWGLTSEVRAPLAVNGKVSLEKDPNILLNETSLYRAVTSVNQVVNFCKKISAQLILLPIRCSEQLQLQIFQLDEYYQLQYCTQFLDLGTDNLHPGPAQHQEWADVVCQILTEK
jgi:hypothetical protein